MPNDQRPADQDWQPDAIEAFAIDYLGLQEYHRLKEWLHRSWVQAAYPGDPTEREMEFFFAHLATVYKLAQAHQALYWFERVESEMKPFSRGLSAEASVVEWSGRGIGDCADELTLRVALSATIPSLASAFDCLACSLWLLLAPDPEPPLLTKVDMQNLCPRNLSEPPKVCKAIENLRGHRWYKDLISYRNAWVHREAGYLALPDTCSGPSVPGSGVAGGGYVGHAAEDDDEPPACRHRLLRPCEPVQTYWHVLSIPRKADQLDIRAAAEPDAAVDQIRSYLGLACGAINGIWRLAMQEAARTEPDGLALRLDFASGSRRPPQLY